MKSRINIARSCWASTIEAVELSDFISFAREFELSREESCELIINFASQLMSNVQAKRMVIRLKTLLGGRARTKASVAEAAALHYIKDPSYKNAAMLLVEIKKGPSVRLYRPTLLQACFSTLQMCIEDDTLPFYETACAVRERYRFLGRRVPVRAVGSTLLLKGLEADVSVVLNADNLNAKNLYVALTRGSRLLAVCSQSPILTPK